MSARPRLLDLFCGAGGATRGYQLAGFHVTGVDRRPQPRYCGDSFVQAEALAFVAAHGREYDAIHASPPCQHYTVLRALHPERAHPDLIAATRAALIESGRPWVMENVPGAPLVAPIMLCGTMFGLKVYRHRLFECTFFLLTPPHAPHRDHTPRSPGKISPRGFIGVYGGGGNTPYRRWAMGIDWMTRDELSQAIPPSYCEFIGRQLMRALEVAA